MSVSHEVIGMGMITTDMKAGLATVPIAFGTVSALFKAFAKVGEKEMGMRTCLGRATRNSDKRLTFSAGASGTQAGDYYGSVGPGFHLIMPFSHSIKKISIQDRIHKLDNIELDDDEGKQIQVHSSIKWGVKSDDDSLYKAIFGVEDENALVGAVTEICNDGLRSVLDGKKHSEMKDKRAIYSDLLDECTSALDEHGSELRRLNLKTVTRTFGQMVVQASPGNLIIPAVVDSEEDDTYAEVPRFRIASS